jgi:hypothetical protein
LSELLVDPEWGVVKYAKRHESEAAIRRVGALCVREADGERVPATEWREARAAAAADAAAAAAAAADAAAAAAAGVAFTRRAIQRWRELAGLDHITPDITATDDALGQILEGASPR